jgi:hypothetical protein
MEENACVLPGCEKPVRYTTLQLCRSCYNRVNWFARRHEKPLQEALEAVIEMDKVLIKHGITDHGKPRSLNKIPVKTSAPLKKGQRNRKSTPAKRKAAP